MICKNEDGLVILNSYIVKTNSSGMHNVMLFQDKKKKPLVYKTYDYTKRGNWYLRLGMGLYTTRPKSRKSIFVSFAYKT